LDVNENANRPKPVNAEREKAGFLRAALYYIDRYGGPRARVLRALERRARRRKLDEATAAPLIADAMARVDELGIVDDAAFAASKARGLRQRGTSKRAAIAKMRAAGLDAETAAAALEEQDAEAGEEAERMAAERYAERRRLGPWRLDPEKRAERRDRDVAAMARAGFPVGLSIQVIDGAD